MTKFIACVGVACLLAACGDDSGTSGTGTGGAGGAGGAGATTSATGGAGGAAACDAPASCADFCATATATCATEYPDAAACETECATWTAGCMGDTSGDTLGCREYHLGAAAMDAATHCPHAGPDGGGVCQ